MARTVTANIILYVQSTSVEMGLPQVPVIPFRVAFIKAPAALLRHSEGGLRRFEHDF